MSGICCLKFQVKFLVLQSLNFINVPQRVYCERTSSGTVCCTELLQRSHHSLLCFLFCMGKLILSEMLTGKLTFCIQWEVGENILSGVGT